MKILHKIFGGIKLSWKTIILFAISIGIYTGIVLSLPYLKNTSFQDIGIGFEWWILFALIIISNSETPKESAFKTFIFFLISQPIVYLVQPNGVKLFLMYYQSWFIYTLFTFPMAWIGWYTKKDNILAPIILSPMLIYLIGHFISYVRETHILSIIFTVAISVALILGIMKNKKLRIIATISGLSLYIITEYITYYLNSH